MDTGVRCKCSSRVHPSGWGALSCDWRVHCARQQHQLWARAQRGKRTLIIEPSPPPPAVAATSKLQRTTELAEWTSSARAASASAAERSERLDIEAEAALTPYIDAARAVSSIVAARDAHTDSTPLTMVLHSVLHTVVLCSGLHTHYTPLHSCSHMCNRSRTRQYVDYTVDYTYV